MLHFLTHFCSPSSVQISRAQKLESDAEEENGEAEYEEEEEEEEEAEEEAYEDYEYDLEHEEAATKVQSVYRGQQTRAEMGIGKQPGLLGKCCSVSVAKATEV
jgi:hypothetical protein